MGREAGTPAPASGRQRHRSAPRTHPWAARRAFLSRYAAPLALRVNRRACAGAARVHVRGAQRTAAVGRRVLPGALRTRQRLRNRWDGEQRATRRAAGHQRRRGTEEQRAPCQQVLNPNAPEGAERPAFDGKRGARRGPVQHGGDSVSGHEGAGRAARQTRRSSPSRLHPAVRGGLAAATAPCSTQRTLGVWAKLAEVAPRSRCSFEYFNRTFWARWASWRSTVDWL
jgi:hypothetical protein